MNPTTAEYQAMLARVAPKHRQTSLGEPVKRESDLAEYILDYCRSKGWLVCRSRTDQRSTIQAGWPDLTIIASAGKTYLLELKRTGGKASLKQLSTIAMAKNLGHVAAIISSREEFHEAIK